MYIKGNIIKLQQSMEPRNIYIIYKYIHVIYIIYIYSHVCTSDHDSEIFYFDSFTFSPDLKYCSRQNVSQRMPPMHIFLIQENRNHEITLLKRVIKFNNEC